MTGRADTGISLSWEATARAESYQVFRDSSASGSFTKKVYDDKGMSCTDSGLLINTVYYYKVRAVNSLGEERAFGAGIGADDERHTPTIKG